MSHWEQLQTRLRIRKQIEELETKTQAALEAALNAGPDPAETRAATFFDAMLQSSLNQCRNGNNPFDDHEHIMNRLRRREFIPRFGLSAISAGDIEWIRRETGNAEFFEVGAAPGMLALECNERGLKVSSSDPDPTGANGWNWRSPRKMTRCSGQQAVRIHRGKNLLWSWPDYNEPYTATVLRGFDGEFVVYIGEGPGGCTGSDEFHDLLERDFDLTGIREIRNFPSIRDRIHVLRRKSRE